MAINVIDFAQNEQRESCVAKKLNKDFYSNGKGEMIALIFGSAVKAIFWENGDEKLFESLKDKGIEEIDQTLSGSKKNFDYSKGTYEKVFIKNLFNEKFLKIWIEEVATYVLYFKEVENGLELTFVEEKDFNEEEFLKTSKIRHDARIKAEQEAELAAIKAEEDAKEAARKEKASKVVVPTMISKIGEKKILAPQEGPRVIGSPRPKTDLTKTDAKGETFRPFAQLKDKLDIGEVTGKNSAQRKFPRGSRPDFDKPTKGENIGLAQEFQQNMEGVGNLQTEAEPVAALA